MNIKQMKATFGKLEGATLNLTEGLNLLEAPNEGGKSTWCGFLRAMLYGIPTKERDKVGFLAEKNRYQPWSGAPMEGVIDLVWRGKSITLRRFQKGAVPFGGFEAVDSKTGETVPGLTAENVGETLLGVPREVFERSAFVGQAGVMVDGNPALEKRIAALVSSGEEDVSFSQTERTLKDWQNHRKHNKSGILPQLEGELAEIEGLLARLNYTERQLTEARGEQNALEARRAELEQESLGQRVRLDRNRRAEYDKAAAYLSACREELAALGLELRPLPSKEELRAAQVDMAYYSTLGANVKLAENRLVEAERAAREAREGAVDPLFSDLGADEAWQRASDDAREAQTQKAPIYPLLLVALGALLIGGGVAAQLLLTQPLYLGVGVAAGLLCIILGIVGRKKAGEKTGAAQAVLARYGAKTPEEIIERAKGYREKCTHATQAEQAAQTQAEALRQTGAQREELLARALGFVKPFAPTVSDYFGISAALSKALSLEERQATAQVKLEGAQKLVSSIPMPTGPDVEDDTPDAPPSEHTPQQTAAMLAAVVGEITRVTTVLATAQGERKMLGDPAELEVRRGEIADEMARRQGEFMALATAMETLGEANADLQARFSPAINQKAGEIFAALTGGKYAQVTLNRAFEATTREAEAVLPRKAITLSQGTVDQLYLAVRLAVCATVLPVDDPVPLVLDDALADFDDGRMALALDYLREAAKGRQILLFTCHSRERRYAEGL